MPLSWDQMLILMFLRAAICAVFPFLSPRSSVRSPPPRIFSLLVRTVYRCIFSKNASVPSPTYYDLSSIDLWHWVSYQLFGRELILSLYIRLDCALRCRTTVRYLSFVLWPSCWTFWCVAGCPQPWNISSLRNSMDLSPGGRSRPVFGHSCTALFLIF